MILLASTDTLQIVLGAAPATTQPVLYAAYVDGAVDETVTQVFRPGKATLAANGTTAVTLVGSPTANRVRKLEGLSCYNADTASMVITVRFVDNGTNRDRKFSLAAGECLEYTDLNGYRVIGPDGSVRSGAATSGAVGSVADLIVALGDETTSITVGAGKVTIRAPRAMTLSKVKASVSTASTSGLPEFDVKKNGTSIFSIRPTIDATEKSTETAATAAVLSTTAIGADDELAFDIVAAGTGAKGAKITLVGTAA